MRNGSRRTTACGCWRGRRCRMRRTPIATAYAGHQFGHFVPQLGDGRAILLGEVVDRGGATPRHSVERIGPHAVLAQRRRARGAGACVARIYCQRSDGRARHSHHALAGRGAHRRDGDARGAVAGRGADAGRLQPHPHRHVPVLCRARRRRRDPATRRPCDRPALSGHAGEAEPYRALLARVIARQAQLVARWMQVGFIHGVMNTDNMSIAGETIDYGPCAFMDAFDPAAVFSSIDQNGPLRLRQPAAHRAVESDAAGRMPAAAAVGRRGHGDRDRQGRAWRSSRLRSMLP